MKKISLIFIAILLVGFVVAISTPQGFNGNIVVKDGKSAEGKILIGYVDGVATGQAIVKSGKFDIVVTDNVGDGGKVEFYIGEEKAEETFTFDTFEITKTDLTFDTIPPAPSSCGDAVCSEDECSFCAVDCVISSCSSNGRCDIEIGEDCANAPNDCGACPIVNPGNGGGSGGGGGGGGGSSGGSPSNTPLSNTNTGSSENNSSINEELSGLSINNLNENENKTNIGFFGMTGAVVGGVSDFAKSGVGISIIVIILVVGVLVIMRKPGKTPTSNGK